MPKSFFAWTSFIVYNGFVLVAAAIPGPEIPEVVQSLNDKQLHVAQYIILSLVTLWAFGYLPESRIREYRQTAALLWGAAVGALTELLQMKTPGRSAEFVDWLADTLGVMLGYLIWIKWIRKHPDRTVRGK